MTYLRSIWDRLTGPGIASPSTAPLTPAQRKAAIARDLEALLNTRVALPAGLLDGHPECADSIVNYGLVDFAQLCLTSSADRRQVCDRLAASISRHKPRLGNVRVALAGRAGSPLSSAPPCMRRRARTTSTSACCWSRPACATRSADAC